MKFAKNVPGEVARTCSNWSKAYFTPFHAIAVNREQKIISTHVHTSLQARVWRALAAVTATTATVDAEGRGTSSLLPDGGARGAGQRQGGLVRHRKNRGVRGDESAC
jgi:hypothetical protein